MAVHAPDALRILGNQSTFEEKRLLGAFQYVYRYCIPLSSLFIDLTFIYRRTTIVLDIVAIPHKELLGDILNAIEQMHTCENIVL